MCGAIIVVASTILFCIHDNKKEIQNKFENIEHKKNLNESCPNKFTTNKSSTEKSQLIAPTEEDFKDYGALDTQKLFVNEIKLVYCQQQKNDGMKEKTMVSIPIRQLLNCPKNDISIVETVVEIKNNKTTTTTTTTTTATTKTIDENKNHHLQVFIQGYFDALQRMLNMKRFATNTIYNTNII